MLQNNENKYAHKQVPGNNWQMHPRYNLLDRDKQPYD